jgi:Peptidase inhibitor family I36
VCLFQHRDAQGVIKYFQYTQGYGNFTYLICVSCGEGDFNDDMSSWVNNSGVKFCWYFDTNFLPYYGTRGPRPMPPEPYRVVNLTRFENDEASSIHRAGIPGC